MSNIDAEVELSETTQINFLWVHLAALWLVTLTVMNVCHLCSPDLRFLSLQCSFDLHCSHAGRTLVTLMVVCMQLLWKHWQESLKWRILYLAETRKDDAAHTLLVRDIPGTPHGTPIGRLYDVRS